MDLVNGTQFPLFRWHLVFTKPRGELMAKSNLERQGYRVYFPRVRRQVSKRGGRCEAIAALFPRYLFVQLNTALQSLGPLRSTLGVANVVKFGTNYIDVPSAIVDGLIHREDPSGLHVCSSRFRSGDRVRIVEGTFSGIDGIFEQESADDRVTVLLSILGRESRIKLPAGSVAAA